MSNPLKHRSHTITDGRDRAPARSYYHAIGFTDEDLASRSSGSPTPGSRRWPCNYHLRDLAERVKQGVRDAGGTPMEFNTIAISDGITMGTEGMKASLISRDLVADSIELTADGYMFDALVAIVACDKTIPGGAMRWRASTSPSVLLYGGSIMPGKYKGMDVTIQEFSKEWASMPRGLISDDELKSWRTSLVPGRAPAGANIPPTGWPR